MSYVTHMNLSTLYTVPLGCEPGQLEWTTVRPLLNRIWDDRFIILTLP